MKDHSALTRLHYELVHGLIQTGACPTNADLSRQLGLSLPETEDLLRSLAAIHGVVLHPHTPAPWILHPFSLTPTLNWIESGNRSWWAPCIWCAFGVATLVGGKVHLHSRYGAEAESVTIPVTNGRPIGFDTTVIHFAVPPARAWDNVHQHCAMVLPFHGAEEIPPWCARHGLPQGEAVPLPQVAELAQIWYGSHAQPDWHKWTTAEAQEIFHHAGLTSAFWNLESKDDRF
jgi:hypothetical protein